MWREHGVADAAVGGQGLGEAGDITHIVQPAGRQARGAALLDVAVQVVFDDVEAMAVAQFQQAVNLGRGERVAGGVMQRAVGHVQHGFVGDQQLLEGVEVHAVAIPGDGDDFGPMQCQIGVHVEVAGVIEQYGVAGFDQQAHQQVDGLHGVGGGDDLVHRRFDAEGRQFHPQGLAQRQVTAGHAVLAHAQRRCSQGTAHGFLQFFGG
ncbi:hypothetical protein D9M71_195440 [compost metagenome]